ncbi:MAG: enoyl-CoA hydratase/isomerase family protein [Polyangiaceae bacterium]
MSSFETIHLDGPGKNALGTPVMRATLDAVRAAKGKPILLTGKGDTFSAGLNLKEIATLDTKDKFRAFLGLFDELIVTLVSHDAPLVAAVNGHAIAGGCFLAMTCDVRVSTSNPAARIGLNEVPLGLVFPPRVLRLAAARLDPSAAFRVLLEGATHSPLDAKALGLVDVVSDDPLPAAVAMLERLSSSPRVAYAHTRAQLFKNVLAITEAEQRGVEEELLPAWIDRRAELLGALAR